MASLPSVSLISLASVKEWLSTGTAPYPSNSDSLLERMVAGASLFAATYLSRSIAPATYAETYNGNDGRQLPLRQTPVILVRSVTLGVTSIAARTAAGQYGFTNDDTSVYIDGGSYGPGGFFWRGVQNVRVTYDAGYQTSDTVPVPVGGILSATDLSRPWNTDRGVAYASGAAFTPVTVPPTVAGTYQVTDDAQDNAQYVFASADVAASVVITYGYTPEDIAQALIEWVGERFKTRGRIGETSQNSGHGQVVSFSQKDMNAAIKTTLNQYRNVVPV